MAVFQRFAVPILLILFGVALGYGWGIHETGTTDELIDRSATGAVTGAIGNARISVATIQRLDRGEATSARLLHARLLGLQVASAYGLLDEVQATSAMPLIPDAVEAARRVEEFTADNDEFSELNPKAQEIHARLSQLHQKAALQFDLE